MSALGIRRAVFRPARIAAALTALAVASAACGNGDDAGKGTGGRAGDDTGAAASTSTAAAPTTLPVAGAYADAGPYEVGVRTFELPGGNLVEVWYPASGGATEGIAKDSYSLASWLPEDLRAQVPPGTDAYEQDAYRDVEASADGPFPLVLFSHGFASFRDQSTFLTTHLASWGMVVAAPDHPSRGLLSVMSGENPDDATLSVADMKSALARVEAANAETGGPLEGRVDSRLIAAIGHSAGGRTILGLAADADAGSRVDTYVSLASGAWDQTALPEVPSLFMAGTGDDIVEPGVTTDAYERAPTPKRYYTFEGAGHLAFSDICSIGADDGGVLALADAFGIEIPEDLRSLASDGCFPDETPPPDVWPAVNHFTTAHLRAVWGLDPEPVGLDDLDAFDGVVIQEQHAGA